MCRAVSIPAAPAWFREIYPAFAKAQRQAWSFLQSADDDALMAAFEAPAPRAASRMSKRGG